MSAATSVSITRRPWFWPGAVIALMVMNACIVGFTLYFALSDRSVSIEPDYYAQALKYEDVVQLRAESTRLGWTAQTSVHRTGSGGEAMLAVVLRSRDGVPLDGAQVRAVAFPNVRSGDRQELMLAPSAGAPGTYATPIRAAISGQWRVRVSVQRGPDHYFHECDLDLPATPTRAD